MILKKDLLYFVSRFIFHFYASLLFSTSLHTTTFSFVLSFALFLHCKKMGLNSYAYDKQIESPCFLGSFALSPIVIKTHYYLSTHKKNSPCLKKKCFRRGGIFWISSFFIKAPQKIKQVRTYKISLKLHEKHICNN